MALLLLGGCKPPPYIGPRVTYTLEVDGMDWLTWQDHRRIDDYWTRNGLNLCRQAMTSDSITAATALNRVAMDLRSRLHTHGAIRLGEQVYGSMMHEWVNAHMQLREALARRLAAEPRLAAVVEQDQPFGPISATLNLPDNERLADTFLLTAVGKLGCHAANSLLFYTHDFYRIQEDSRDLAFTRDTFDFYKTLLPPLRLDSAKKEYSIDPNSSTIAYVEEQDTAKVGQFLRKNSKLGRFRPSNWVWEAAFADSVPARFALYSCAGRDELADFEGIHVEWAFVTADTRSDLHLHFKLSSTNTSAWHCFSTENKFQDLIFLIDGQFLKMSPATERHGDFDPWIHADLSLACNQAAVLPLLLKHPLPFKLHLLARSVVTND